MKRKLCRFLAMPLSICTLVGSLGTPTYAAGDVPEGSQIGEEAGNFQAGTRSEYEGDSFKAVYTLNDIWEDGFNFGVELVNTSENSITDWYAQIPFSAEIESVWGIEIVANENGTLKFKNLGWNADILPGQSVNFGFVANGNFDGFPESFEILNNNIINYDGLLAELIIPQIWDGGFNGLLEITNNTEIDYQNWKLEFDYENEIVTLWDARIIEHSEDHYVVAMYEYDKTFAVGEKISLGFQVHEGDPDADIKNLIVSTIGQEEAVIPPEEEDEEWKETGSYYKEVTEADIVYDEESGETYAKDQLLVGVMLGVNKSLVEEMAEYYDAEIVGYLSQMQMYQFEFRNNKSYSDLEELIDMIESNSFVTYAMLNYVDDMETSYTPVDGYTDIWDVTYPDGQQWGLEALRLPRAWDYKDQFQGTVKIGVCDDCFETNHADLKFKKIMNDFIVINGTDHGTHVSGTIAATFDNGIGVTGVATDVELYGYCKGGLFAYSTFIQEAEQYESLIYNNVRAINVSYGYNYKDVYYASIGDATTIKKLDKKSKALSDSLQNIILEGYDFLIVNAAGNESDKYYNAKFEHVSATSSDMKYYLSEADAKYGYYSNGITDPIVKSRVIVVGAAQHDINSGVVSYNVTNFSARGLRVDVYAPGQGIYSTVRNVNGVSSYDYMSGTSMAAPHITGLAALIWQANPTLTASQVKDIIINSQGRKVTDPNHTSATYYMPDAQDCIEKALAAPGGVSPSDNDMPKGTLKGKVVRTNGNALSDITLYLVRTSTGEANLKDYYYTVVTGANGEYEFTVPAGVYELSAIAKSGLYLPVRIKDLSIDPGDTRYFENIVMEDITDDAIFGEVKIYGAVYNAIDGRPVSNAEIHVRRDWNSCNGSYCYQEATSDSSGNFVLDMDYLGNYTVEVKANGYITGYYNVVAVLSTAGIRQSMVLTPVLSDDEYRVILTWDDDPRDLDSHLVYSQNGTKLMHVYFGDKVGSIDGVNRTAQLDVDNTGGYGPETVTMTFTAKDLESNGKFVYCVHKYAGYEDLKQSNAIVRLYSGNTLIDTYHVPNANGNLWRVFQITDGGVSKISVVTTVSSISSIQ